MAQSNQTQGMAQPQVRIFQPAKTAMQSGLGNTRCWVMEFEPTQAKTVDRLMGWTGSGDMNRQVRLFFASREEAIAYAQRQGFAFEVRDPARRMPKIKAYADNFSFKKVS